jgi:predicted NBD/HSP70 family sugar kinase
MAARRLSTVHDLRRGNRAALLWSLYFGQQRSRQELGEATGLSSASVSNVVGDLIAEGAIVEAGSVNSEGGRPRILLRVNPDYGYVVGVDVGETRVRVGLFDLAMTERAKADQPLLPGRHDVGVVVAQILAGLDAVFAESGICPDSVLGVGIGVPGIVQQSPEVIVHGPSFGWSAVPLERLLRAGTNLPLYIDNGAKTMGQAELWFGAGRGAQHAIVALIGSGVGASVITEGATYRGATSSAGEWGHTTIAVGGRACRCGAFGCLESYVGAEAILDRYRDALGGGPVPGTDQETSLAALIDAAETSATAREVLNETAEYLGAAIGNLINLFDPERIVLGGWAGLQLGRRLLPAIRESARRHALAHPFAQTSIELCRLGPDAVALGAATLPIERFLSDGHRSDHAGC